MRRFLCTAILSGLLFWQSPLLLVAENSNSKEAKPTQAERTALINNASRVLFLGDSITFAGDYIAQFETWLYVTHAGDAPLVINAGLPSETVSGLSEDGHAGGQFPRPDVAERLSRVIAIAKPDLVFACYGINCGIYEPFNEERFAKYRQGVLALKQQVEAAGATLVLMTPPTFDDERSKKPFSYNEVLDRYAAWLVGQRESGWIVIDLHRAMSNSLRERRVADPSFTFQPDAVHPNEAGHQFIANEIMRWFGDVDSAAAETPSKLLQRHQHSPEAWPLIQQRTRVLRDAYVGAAGHKRPGIAAGLPLDEAQQKAAALTQAISSL